MPSPMKKLTVRVPERDALRAWSISFCEDRNQSEVLREALAIGLKKMSRKRKKIKVK